MKLQVEHLVRHFGDVKAVDDISFSVEAGQIYGFIGPNGAGKTTTLRILATLDMPTRGDAKLGGRSLVDHPEAARHKIGFMPDAIPSHSDIAVFDYLDFFARCYGLKGTERRRVLSDVMAFTGLGKLADRMIGNLSKGMKQRLSLARALVHDPQFLILDEPAAGLDPRARVELRELLLALAEQGKGILISSHILTELSEICHGAIIIEQGKLVGAGEIEQLRRGDRPLVTVRVRSLDGKVALNRALLTCHEVAEVRQVGEELEIDLTGDETAAAAVLSTLVKAGVRVVEFRRLKEDLEDVFMQVTRGDVA